MLDDIIIMAADPTKRIKESSAHWGRLAIGYSDIRELFHVVGISESRDPPSIDIALRHIRVNTDGVWCRATPGLHVVHEQLARIGYPLRADLFRTLLPVEPGLLAGRHETIVVTHSPQGTPEWAG